MLNLNPISAFKRSREAKHRRLAAERREEREHQLLMLDTIFGRMVELQKTSNEGLLELAKAQAAQAEVMSSWIKSFQTTDATPMTPSFADEEEVWEPVMDIPAEFQLAYSLDKVNQKELEDFDREGLDNI